MGEKVESFEYLRKVYSLFSGAKFEQITPALWECCVSLFVGLTHTLTHTAKKPDGHSGKFRVKCCAMVEKKGLETP